MTNDTLEKGKHVRCVFIENKFYHWQVSNLSSPRETDFDSDDHLANSSLAGFEPTQTDLYSVVSTAWLIPVECASNEPIQKRLTYFCLFASLLTCFCTLRTHSELLI